MQLNEVASTEVSAAKSVWGPTPLCLPIDSKSIKRSEMYAFWYVLQHSMEPFCIWTDHKEIVKGLAKGKAWCTSSRRHHADLLQGMWWKLEDHGIAEPKDLADVVKHVKAHRSLKTINTS